MMRTMVDLLGVKPLSLFDATADPMSDVFTLTPNFTPYSAVLPGSLCQPPVDPNHIPECASKTVVKTRAVKPLHNGAWWEQATSQFDFRGADKIDSAAFNKVLWRGVMGDKPYPPIRNGEQPETGASGRPH